MQHDTASEKVLLIMIASRRALLHALAKEVAGPLFSPPDTSNVSPRLITYRAHLAHQIVTLGRYT
jgi:hypothetical protein